MQDGMLLDLQYIAFDVICKGGGHQPPVFLHRVLSQAHARQKSELRPGSESMPRVSTSWSHSSSGAVIAYIIRGSDQSHHLLRTSGLRVFPETSPRLMAHATCTLSSFVSAICPCHATS
jgi:hypothetical protein